MVVFGTEDLPAQRVEENTSPWDFSEVLMQHDVASF